MSTRYDPDRGFGLLRNPGSNKSTAFTDAERDRLGLRGLLPPAVCDQDTQVVRVLENLQRKSTNLERYIFLLALQGRNEKLFYRTLIDHVEEMLPLVYTPTVGEACRQFAHIFRQPRGFYVTPEDCGQIRPMLENWPESDVRAIVVTDGERILGLGDLGANGMGISIGKLALYTGFGGIPPHQCMPIMLDVGTNNKELLDDPLYLGRRCERLRGKDYDALVDELITALQDAFPLALIQFEDFATNNAFRLLDIYRDKARCFNDDIQGTAAVVLAGVLAAARLLEQPLDELRVLFLGAGSAGTGIADLIVEAAVAEGCDGETAREKLWFVSSKGLLVESREDLRDHQKAYVREGEAMSFIEAVKAHKPHVLIGATGQGGAFTEEVVRLMASLNEKPVIFALSNPTDNAECTAEQAYEWTDGRVVFASGSPFAPIERGEEVVSRPSQANNVYIFPGIALGVIACEAERISESMLLVAARELSQSVSADELADGELYPRLCEIRSISARVAAAVAREAYAQGLTSKKPGQTLERDIVARMYDPHY